MRDGRRAALYERVTTGQDPETQLRALRTVAAQHGWQIIETYIDRDDGDASDARPALDRLTQGAEQLRFNVVAASSAGRLADSMTDLVVLLDRLNRAGCHVYLEIPPIDTATPDGKTLISALDLYAQLEREIIQARINAGLQKARTKGKRLGRPGVDPKTAAKISARAEKRLKNDTNQKIGGAFGVSEATVRKVVAQSKRASRAS